MLLGFEFAGRRGLLAGFFLSALFLSLSFVFKKDQFLRFFKGRFLKGQDPWGLTDQVKTLERVFGLSNTKVFLVEQPWIVAAITQDWKEDFQIFISQKLLHHLNDSERSALMTLLMSRTQLLSQSRFHFFIWFEKLFFFLSSILDGIYPVNFFSQKFHKPFLTLLSPVIWFFRNEAIPQANFLRADEKAYELSENSLLVRNTLQKLSALQEVHPFTPPHSTNVFFLIDPEDRRLNNRFLIWQPSLEKRIHFFQKDRIHEA